MKTDLKQLKREASLANNQIEVVRIHEKVLSEVQEVKSIFTENQMQLKRILYLPRGPKGDKGDKGESIRGIPGRDGRDGQDGRDGIIPIKGKDYFTKEDKDEFRSSILQRIRLPKDGETPLVDYDKAAEKAVELIKEKQLIGTDNVKGLRNEISSYRNQLAMKQAGQHGGGDTVAAGTNITITTNSDGVKVINSTGGGSGLTILEPTGSVNSSNTEFAFTEEPTVIVSDGSTLRVDHGWTWDGGTLTATMDSAPNYDLYGMV